MDQNNTVTPGDAHPAAWASGVAYLATVQLQALHGCDTPQPEGVTNEEGYFAQEAYKRATGSAVLGVGITNALGAAAAVRRGRDGAATAPQSQATADDGWEWAVVEVMGHRRHAGRTREVERFGVKMVRVDVPTKGDPAAHGWTTHFYPGSALFSFTPAEEEACLRANKPYEPPARLSLPRREEREGDPEEEGDGIPF